MEVKPLHNEILDKKFTHKYRTGYVSVDGYVFPNTIPKWLPVIADFEVYESDIWVTSYPKTGTTWTQEMVWLIANDLDYKVALETELDTRFPFLEFGGLFERDEKNTHMPQYLKDPLALIEKMKQPRFIKTHLPWNFLPKQIQNGSRKPKIIHVVRNPKDTCVSYFHHMRLLEGFTGNFEEYCQLFLADEVNYSPFWKNISSYWQHRVENDILFLRYEDMKRDLPSIIRRVSKFLNKSYTEDEVTRLAKHLSFDSMKSNQAVNKERLLMRKEHQDISVAGDSFIRSGKVGDYKNIMNEEMVKRFDEWTRGNVKDLEPLFS